LFYLIAQFFHDITSAGPNQDLIQALISSSDLSVSLSNDIIRVGNTYSEEDWIPDNNGLPVQRKTLHVDTHMDVLMAFVKDHAELSARLLYRVCWIGFLHAVLEKDVEGASSLLIKLCAKFNAFDDISQDKIDESAGIICVAN
jgi:hypothetical protein